MGVQCFLCFTVDIRFRNNIFSNYLTAGSTLTTHGRDCFDLTFVTVYSIEKALTRLLLTVSRVHTLVLLLYIVVIKYIRRGIEN